QGATPAALVLAALELVLHRWTGETDLVLGAAVSLRDRADVARTVGCLVGAALVRGVVAPERPFADLLRGARASLLDAMSDALVPLPSLLPALRRPGPGLRVLFNALPPRPPLEGWDGLEADLLDVEDPGAPLDATVYVQERGARLRLEVVHDAWLLTAPRAAALAAQLEAALRQAVDDPARPVADFDLVTGDAREQLPDAAAPLPANDDAGTLDAAVEAQAARAPRRLALVDPRRAWSYDHLVLRARDLARDLQGAGVAPGARVAVWAHRGAPLAAALLGTLRAGATFAVLDPEQPVPRLAAQVAALRPAALVVLDEAPPPPAELLAAAGGAAQIPLVADAHPRPARPDSQEDDPTLPPGPAAPAYVAFTSGTTGAPRAVVGAHGPVLHFLAWQRARFALGPDDRVAVLSGLGHDPLLRDLFAPLTAGASARVPDPAVRRDPARLLAWLRAERVTIAHVTPGLLDVLAAAPGGADGALPDLRLVFSGGDRLTRAHAAALSRLAPTARLVSLYGTTETPQGVGAFDVDGDDDPAAGCPSAVVPAGRGIEGVQLLVLRSGGRPAGVGELGEVHVRTPHLTLGYLDDPEGSRARWLPGPMFRTGDLGRYRPDGAVELARRADRQVKVRGHRIELGEVEAALQLLPGVARAVATLREGAGGARLLAWARADAPGLDGAALRRALAASLPEPAVPAAVVVVEGPWPLTPNGKVDVARLPDDAPAPACRAPRTQLEVRLAALWARLLERERVGVDEDFFALGGHSLLAVRMLAAVGDELGVVVPVAALQRAPTVAGLARALHALDACPEEPLVIEVRRGDPGLAPLWLLHPAGGHVVFGRRLAAGLDPARPVLGLQAQGLDGRRPPLRTVEAMVDLYLGLLRARQPRGPYHLVGPSFGGLLAWEMARRLAAEGEEVALLAMLDTFAPGYPRALPPHRRALDHALALWRRDAAGRRRYVEERLAALRARLRGLGRRRFQVRDAAPTTTAGDGALVDVVRRVIEANYEASARHAPDAYDGPLLLVRAARRPWLPGLSFDDPLNGWGPLARGRVETRLVDATHQGLLDPPAVEAVAAHLDAALRALPR
ncbi:MAG: AMP-binding protein, partial [Planctomycetes bacterium]|nr:AMP-binding protein [Planctomycetota bacterium]